jgi:phenylacetyl-CoA:acceptor oxidoreductase 26-kDa subunit
MSYGPSPWLQRNWDLRAALNFALGGTGAGALVVLAFSDLAGAVLQAATLIALVLIAAGLVSVWLEIGRPARAVHVLFNPFTSWMTRESFAAALVFVFGAGTLASSQPGLAPAAGLAALAFVYCQGRILQNARGIPAWREPMVTPLVVVTGLAEGAGAVLVVSALAGAADDTALAWCFFAVVLRAWAWPVYLRHVACAVPQPALDALDRAGRVLLALGTLAPLALLVTGVVFPAVDTATAALAGAATVASGWTFKITLVTRAALNQGFALPELPARGRG